MTYVNSYFSDLEADLDVSSNAQPLPQALPRQVKTSVGKIIGSIYSVSKNTLGQDSFMTALGGSLVIDGDTITTQNNATQDFNPIFRITDATGSADTMGGTTTKIIVQPLQENVSIPATINNSYNYTAFTVPLGAIMSATTKYNMYIEPYEEFAMESNSPELSMLDVYGTVLSLDREGEGLNTQASRFTTNKFSISSGRELTPAQYENVITYFKDYTISNPGPSSNYKNLIYPHDSIVSANSAFSMAKDSFPFYIGFDIDLAQSGDVCDSLVSSKYADKFTTNIAATIESGDLFRREDFVQQTPTGIRNVSSRIYESNSLATYDASSFISSAVILGDENDLKSSFPELQPVFSDTINALKYLVDTRNILNKNAMNVVDIANGQREYSETIVYRIAKFAEGDDTTPIQNFYFFNSPDSSIFKFVDSQVVPGKLYNYRIYSYSFVATTSYDYTKIDKRETYDIVTVKTAANSKVVESLIFETTGFVTSLPPVSPEVEFRSFLGDERKIQISFQDPVQKIVEQPIILNQEENTLAMRLRESQGLLPNAPLTFFNDDETKVYEIYRTTTPPDSVDQFSDKLSRRVTGNVVLEAIKADQTYYYMFRTIDNHGNISNPSLPFEVTLVGGASPYLLVGEYFYPAVAESKKEKTKGFKRFMRIRPALQQLMLNTASGIQDKKSSLDVTNVNLGVATDGKIWGKKYKIRIISKETGKKIDFNFKYDYKFDYREQ